MTTRDWSEAVFLNPAYLATETVITPVLMSREAWPVVQAMVRRHELSLGDLRRLGGLVGCINEWIA